MDTSETYIKMCQKATEVTGDHVLEAGDFVVYLHDCRERGLTHTWAVNAGDWGVYAEGDWESPPVMCSWLPRQDQLQEINGKDGPFDSVWDFQRWMQVRWDYLKVYSRTVEGNAEYALFTDRFTSREQLEMAYLMDRKYHKQWTGEEWA